MQQTQENAPVPQEVTHQVENVRIIKVIKPTPSGKDGIVLLENGDYKLGDLVFYPGGLAFFRNGIRIDVPCLEGKLMKILLESEHCNQHRRKIREALWGDKGGEAACNDKLNSTVWRLRKALAKLDPRIKIESERGKGYELCIYDTAER